MIDEDLNYGKGHLAQGAQRLVVMNPLTQVYLGYAADTVPFNQIQQQAGLYDSKASNAKTASYIRGGSLLLSGASNIWGT